MSVDLLIASHLRLADEALKAARSLLADGNRNAVYQIEQAVEHIVLALAQSESVHFGRSQHHQLDSMIRSLPAENLYRSGLRDIAWLEAYATAFRYPRTKGGLNAPPPRPKLDAALEKATRMLLELATYFGVDTDISATEAASNIRPPRGV